MRFTTPGSDCIFCACRKTAPAEMQGSEIAQAIFMPFVLHKCPHCLEKFWRLDIQKLIIYLGMVLVTAGILFVLLRSDFRG
jgi:hypothetical protein